MSMQDLPHQSPLLDQEQLQMLVEAGASESAELLQELLDLFEEESGHKFEELKAHFASGNEDGMIRSSHALAGSSANVGACVVWKKAKVVENLCKEGKIAEAAGLLADLESTYDQTMIALKAFAAGLK